MSPGSQSQIWCLGVAETRLWKSTWKSCEVSETLELRGIVWVDSRVPPYFIIQPASIIIVYDLWLCNLIFEFVIRIAACTKNSVR